MIGGGGFQAGMPGKRGKSRPAHSKNRKNAHKPAPGPKKVRAVRPRTPYRPASLPKEVREKIAPRSAHAPPHRPSAVAFKGPRSGIAIVGNFSKWSWGQHPDEAYLADALEILGMQVYRIQADSNAQSNMKAEWALFTGHSVRRHERWRATHRTIVWTLDWLPTYPERRHIIAAGRRADIFVTSDRFDWERTYGIENHFYLPGACESIIVDLKPDPVRTCAFLGSLYSPRREEIAKIVAERGGTVLSTPGQWIYGAQLASFCQATKVVIGDNVLNDVPGYWSSRNYVIPGAGGFLLTPRVPGLETQFQFGKHIAVYDGLDSLRAELDRWIHDNAAREIVRRGGWNHARAYHHWGERARALIERMTGVIA